MTEMLETMPLHSVSAFKGLTNDELTLVRGCCEDVALKGNTLIFKEKEPARYLYSLCNGKVSIRYRVPYRYVGKEHSIAIIEPGGTFGWSSLGPSAHYQFSAYCLEDNSRALRCDREVLLKVLENNHTIGYKIMKNLALVAGTRFVALQNEIAKRDGQDFMNGW